MTIEENVVRNEGARVAASEAMQFLCELSEEIGNEELFWHCIAESVMEFAKIDTTPRVVRVKPMTDEEAKDYGRQETGFGEFWDAKIKDVPLDRLLWYDKKNTELARYLASDYVQREQ